MIECTFEEESKLISNNATRSGQVGEVPSGLGRECGYTLPVSMFCSNDTYRDELVKIFADSWQYVGPAQKVANPGDRILASLGSTPIVVTRNRQGELRGFVNACRHRLHPVAIEDGCSPMFQCPYHGWTYSLDGALQSAPRCSTELDLDKNSHGLLSISVHQVGQWIFANRDKNADAMDVLLEDCFDTIERMSKDSSRFSFVDKTVYNIKGNWKLFTENALECYHCPLIHRESFAKAFDVSPESYKNYNHRHAITQSGPTKYLPESAGQEDPKGFSFVFLPPNSFIAMDKFVMFAHRVEPTGPDTCRMTVDIHVDQTLPGSAVEEWLDIYTRTLEEDQAAVERQQICYASGDLTHGRLLEASEASIRWFEAWVSARLHT